jgi:hypothetical protein
VFSVVQERCAVSQRHTAILRQDRCKSNGAVVSLLDASKRYLLSKRSPHPENVIVFLQQHFVRFATTDLPTHVDETMRGVILR